ncbi:3-hydroxyacyl-CoA dehydrogenase [Acinetobacter sp. ANC 4910]|uniref:3-hydroxyacyl-CoA dehydrogenase n=1 Tax=Acinetobacter sp. ANC 4910 TaxID=2529850 RepID=UPI001038F587|nr:3-hydroxyacyl-CoA dehydrogenase [Acinetobacter sp. ANC 4910]TCB36149.1 3-hydroxyacyl-CoA dehydrogenase [Acinetobacter sp. ANC 4910]
MNFKNVTVAGSGVLGYQIAFQTAFHGFKVSVYDINDDVLAKAKAKFFELSECYKRDLNATQEQLDNTFNNLSYQSNLAEAVKDADLVIEAVPEDPNIKRNFYEQLSQVAPERTVFATNTSTLMPSQFAEFTGRPEKFLALHFANMIWINNMAEIMGHSSTDSKVFEDVVEFAQAIGMLPLPIYKEQPGHLLNSMLVPFLISALDLWVKEVSQPETIDKAWMKSFGSPKGPFAILDIIGINTVYNVAKLNVDTNPLMVPLMQKLEAEFITPGHLGMPTGKGFYNYPNPAYEAADFLK